MACVVPHSSNKGLGDFLKERHTAPQSALCRCSASCDSLIYLKREPTIALLSGVRIGTMSDNVCRPPIQMWTSYGISREASPYVGSHCQNTPVGSNGKHSATSPKSAYFRDHQPDWETTQDWIIIIWDGFVSSTWSLPWEAETPQQLQAMETWSTHVRQYDTDTSEWQKVVKVA